MTDLLQIITDAAAKERARLEVMSAEGYGYGDPGIDDPSKIRWTICQFDGENWTDMAGVLLDDVDAAQDYKEHLVALAILKAISEAGLAVVPVEPTPVMYNCYAGWVDKMDDRTDEENTDVLWGAWLAETDLIPAVLEQPD